MRVAKEQSVGEYGVSSLWPWPLLPSSCWKVFLDFLIMPAFPDFLLSSTESSWQCQNLPFYHKTAPNTELIPYTHLRICFSDPNKLFNTHIWWNFEVAKFDSTNHIWKSLSSVYIHIYNIFKLLYYFFLCRVHSREDLCLVFWIPVTFLTFGGVSAHDIFPPQSLRGSFFSWRKEQREPKQGPCGIQHHSLSPALMGSVLALWFALLSGISRSLAKTNGV